MLLKRILVGNFLGQKKIWLEIFLVKKIGSEFFFRPKKFGLEIFLGQKKFGSEFFKVKQNLRRKFVLDKFYFGLLGFVCVVLLTTATQHRQQVLVQVAATENLP